MWHNDPDSHFEQFRKSLAEFRENPDFDNSSGDEKSQGSQKNLGGEGHNLLLTRVCS